MKDLKSLKVAIIQDYLVQYGGAEKTLESWLNIFPQATIYTSLYEAKNMSAAINSKQVVSLRDFWLGKVPGLYTLQKFLTVLMPWIFESFDLHEYDLVISNGTAWAKSVLTHPDQLHISYIHTPPRFLYGYSVESQKRDKWYFKPFVMIVDHFLRIWDVAAAQRPDFIITNSKETQARIKKFYSRDAQVIYPPVDVTTSTGQPVATPEKFYLALGRLAAYKNFDLLIKTFNETPQLNLVIAGTGQEEANLKKLITGSNITMTGKVSDEQKAYLYNRCQAVVFPVEYEDFGIVPVEAMAYGKPVLAHKSGGVLETIKPNVSGMFFDKITVESFKTALLAFDQSKFDATTIRSQAGAFSKERFETEATEFIQSHLK